MVSRLFLAGACALGLATAAAAPAAADLAQPESNREVPRHYPAAVQVWTPAGLDSTIQCVDVAVHPVCDPAGWPNNREPLIKEKGGYRFLARSGRWFELGGNEATVNAIDHADATGGPGATTGITGLDELDPWTPPSGATAAKKGVKRGAKVAKRGAKKGKRAAKRLDGKRGAAGAAR